MRLSTTIAFFVMLMTLPAWAADDIDAVAADLEQGGDLAAEDAEMFKEQLRTRLGAGEAACTGEEQAACQQKLQQQVRACHRLGKQNGQIKNTEDGAAVAAAVMMMTGGGGDAERAGELVKSQLQHQWKAEQVGDAAKEMRQLRHRWRHQTMKMVGECAGAGTCSAEEAQVAVRAMNAASQRADADARRVARTARAAMAEHALEDKGDGDKLKKRLRKRLRLKGEGGTESTVGQGEQHRHRYRHQMDGEGRRGGKYGGSASSGEGVGAGNGVKPRWAK